jgi:hypothetical protein
MFATGFACVLVAGILMYHYKATSEQISIAVMAIGAMGALISGLRSSRDGRA